MRVWRRWRVHVVRSLLGRILQLEETSARHEAQRDPREDAKRVAFFLANEAHKAERGLPFSPDALVVARWLQEAAKSSPRQREAPEQIAVSADSDRVREAGDPALANELELGEWDWLDDD